MTMMMWTMMLTMMVMTMVMTMIMTKKTMKMMLRPVILVMLAMAISRFAQALFNIFLLLHLHLQCKRK